MALILIAFAFPTTAMTAGDVQYVRVLLSTDGAKSLTIPVTGSYTLVESQRAFTDGTLTVSGSGSTVTVSHSREGQLYTGKMATIERASLSRDAGALKIKTVAGTYFYLGHFAFTAQNGALTVVNRVPMSHYLYGVVGYEMSNTFPLEALKAQAIAAKGYVLLRRKSSGSYDIGDTSSDQVYRGYDQTDTNVISAVDGTITDVLYYNGAYLQCYYAASNGGWMILPSVRWSSKEFDGAYAKGLDPYDMANPSTPRETVLISGRYSEREMGTKAFAFLDARLMAAVAAAGVIPANFVFGAVKSIDRVEASESAGYASDRNYARVRVDATVRADLCDDRIPSPTPTFEPTPSPTPTFEPTPSPTPTFEPTETPEAGAEPTDPTPSPTPTFDPTPSPTPTFDPTPSPTPEPELTRDIKVSVSFSFADMVAAGLYTAKTLKVYYAEPAANGWNLLHARYGHGVGMSQRGAQQMANLGMSYREILGFYYPGATLGTMDYTFPETVAGSVVPVAQTVASTGKIASGTVNLREKANTSSASLEKLSQDTTLILLGMTGEWYYALAPSGNKGYVRYDYVLLTGGNMIARGVIDGSAVNYRTGPGKSYAAIGQLSEGTQLGVYGMVDGWYKVQAMTTGGIGFVLGSYVKMTEPLAENASPDAIATEAPTAVPTNTPVPTATPVGFTPTPIVISFTPTPTLAPTMSPTPVPTPSNYTSLGYINATGVNIRAGSSTSAKSYGKLMKQTELGVYKKSGSWYRVRVLATGLDGYVYAKYVSLGSAPTPTPESAPEATVAPTQTLSKGYVNASGVNLRAGEGTAYKSLGKLRRNTTVEILGSSGSWYRVRVSSADQDGYIFAKYVTISAKTQEESLTGVVTGNLNLRSVPTTGKSSKVLLTMPRGAIVTVLTISNGWCYVNYQGTWGYCVSSYVRVD